MTLKKWSMKESLPSTAVETAIAQCTSHCTVVRGHCLNTSIVLAAVHSLSGLFRVVSVVEPSLFRPLPTPLPPSLISNVASVDVNFRMVKMVKVKNQFGQQVLKIIQQSNLDPDKLQSQHPVLVQTPMEKNMVSQWAHLLLTYLFWYQFV